MLRPHVRSSPCKPFHLVDDIKISLSRSLTKPEHKHKPGLLWDLHALPDGMKAACCWNCMLARACWYGNMPALNIVVAPLAFSSAGLFGKGGNTGGSPWWRGMSSESGQGHKRQSQWHSEERERDSLGEKKRSDQAAAYWYCTCQKATGRQKCSET